MDGLPTSSVKALNSEGAASVHGPLQSFISMIDDRRLDDRRLPSSYKMVKWVRSMELIGEYYDIGDGYGGWRADVLHYSRLAPI